MLAMTYVPRMTQRRLLSCVLTAMWVLGAGGCKKDAAPSAATPPAAPSTAPPAAGAESTTSEPGTEPGAAEGVPAAGDPETPVTTAEPAGSEEGEAAGSVASPPLDRLEPPTSAAVPDDNLLLVIRKAETSCAVNQPQCNARDALAAKMATRLEDSARLLQEGTDGQKKALRAALLRVRSPELDALLVSGLVRSDGLLDTAVVAHAVALRTEAAVEPLASYLQKAVGPEALRAIDALSALGTEKASPALKAALDDPRLRPWAGAACRGLSRLDERSARTRMVELGAALNATDRQRTGCRGAEAAFRMLESVGNLVVSVRGRHIQVSRVFIHQPLSNPLHVEVTFGTTSEASCEQPGASPLRLRVPLDRKAEPVVGQPVVPVLFDEEGERGSGGAFYMQFDDLKLVRGEKASGAVYVSDVRSGEMPLIVSGRFEATYCGVRQ